uniref:RdRp n=1 Tax=Beihai partiti-like virus 8 TaxID=1922510 RepID=A0A1L3KLG7_9VIRU|nr:RdRp [Beihai partiti-like virus 8]
MDLAQAKAQFTDLSKSAGFNYSGSKTKNDICYDECNEVMQRLAGGDQCLDYRSSIGYRSHLVRKDDPDKVRIIHVTAGPLCFIEKTFAVPIQHAMINHPYGHWATGWTWDRHGGQVILQRFDPNKTCSLDFQSFDLCCRVRLTRQIFSIWKELFDLTPFESRVFDSLVESHCLSILKSDKHEYTLTDGIRTGSAFTHIMGTCVSMWLMHYAGVKNFLCYGDDVIAEGTTSVIRYRLLGTGFSIHPKKSKDKHIQWLGLKLRGRKWVLEDRQARIAKVFIPEPGKKSCALETRMQASILNAGKDPLAEEFLIILEKYGCDVLSSEIREMLSQWGQSYEGVPYATIRELYEYVTAEFE